MLGPCVVFLLGFDVPRGWSFLIFWEVAKLGFLRETVTKKSDPDRILVDVDDAVMEVVSHIPVIVHGLLDITVVFVFENTLLFLLVTECFHNRVALR